MTPVDLDKYIVISNTYKFADNKQTFRKILMDKKSEISEIIINKRMYKPWCGSGKEK